MSERQKSNLWKYSIIFGFFFGLIAGVLLWHTLIPVQYVEISPKQPKDPLGFYVSYLKGLNYTVIEKELSTNEYSELEDFKEFLWVLKYGNFTECYVDYGETGFLFGKKTRVAKLWLQLDGVYWELRMK